MRYFNDLTETVFAEHQLSTTEMFHIISKMEGHTINGIFQELDRTYKIVLDFVHEVQDALEEIPSLTSTESTKLTRFTLLLARKAPSKRVRASADSKKGRGTFYSGKPPVVTLVRRSDGRVRFLVRENLEDVNEDIVEYGDENDPAILCTDQYTIYDGIDEHNEIDCHLAINHDEHCVVGNTHTNSCENCHSFLRNCL